MDGYQENGQYLVNGEAWPSKDLNYVDLHDELRDVRDMAFQEDKTAEEIVAGIRKFLTPEEYDYDD